VDFIFNQPLVTSVDSEYFHIIMGTGPNDRADTCIHAWGIAAGCEDCYLFHDLQNTTKFRCDY
jgi:hypothetical protein